MQLKPLHVVFLAGLLSLSIGVGMKSGRFIQSRMAEMKGANNQTLAIQTGGGIYIPYNNDTLAGNYLAAHFAQGQYDWASASKFMDKVLASSNPDPQLIKRAMVISMGSGDTTRAFALTNALLQSDPQNSLGLLFKTMEALHKNDFQLAKTTIAKVPAADNVDFIIPAVSGWINAATGTLDVNTLKDGSINLYHAIFIADYMKRPDIVESLVELGLSIRQITALDMKRFADIYVHIGKPDKALPLFEKIHAAVPNELDTAQQIENIKAGHPVDRVQSITNPVDGVALAMEDMAKTLYAEYSDDSARVFGQMALYLNKNMTVTRMLLAEIDARHERFNDAIAMYQSIPPESEDYIQARRRAADFLADAGRTQEALKEIEGIINHYNDVDAIMQAGDIYRRDENYSKALEYYNRAAKQLGDTIPAEYWTLHYARGMAYERMNQWSKAETELKAALAFQPDNPMILNYLGYAWADQGTNLDQSLDMIRKAVLLSPDDGYITDSLGWVLYRKGDYKEAIPHLERAVELLPYDPTINDHLGDAYWRIGRKLEARFQWNRAKNNSEDATLNAAIDEKLAKGLPEKTTMEQAAIKDDGNLKKQ